VVHPASEKLDVKAPLLFSPLGNEPLKITSPFGQRKDPVTKKKAGHNGVDLHAVHGTACFAPDAGVIEAVYTNDAGGLQILLRLASGWRCGYAHLSEALVVKGQRVARGEQIARSGNSGAHTDGAHLHFTLEPPGRDDNVDPAPYLLGKSIAGPALVAGVVALVGAHFAGVV
jgi:murein DD-endopeptidase MepM/ murein hydrolase activator NlpD